ncbi:hypothetical protein [Endozoicomonas sp. ONNA1]|uniref:hypothetical protein n=1 Tax=Endozoicomonas sp. ONNA1 TaxID=2828740 RepID=UPI0021480CA2|nr:hypothetical protein [Endozoicomonas sp. ONNA1]
MDFMDIVLKAGKTAVASMGPGGAAAVTLANMFFGNDEQVDPKTVTGDELALKIKTLPPETRAQLMSKRIDLEITEANNWRAIQEVIHAGDDYGKKIRSWVILAMAAITVVVLGAYATGMLFIAWDKKELPSWESIGVVLTIPSLLLRSYFGTQFKTVREGINAGMGGRIDTQSPISKIIDGLGKK